jgi:hypothetical protein
MTILAPAMTAPVPSLTVPIMVPVDVCDQAQTAVNSKDAIVFFMFSLR